MQDFVNPIHAGQNKGDHEELKNRMKYLIEKLHTDLENIVHRRNTEKNLIKQREFNIHVKMTTFQKFLYLNFLVKSLDYNSMRKVRDI